MKWDDYRKEAAEVIRDYQGYLIHDGQGGTVEYDKWVGAEVHVKTAADDRPAHGAIALAVIYDRMRKVAADATARVWQSVAEVNKLGDKLVWTRDLLVDNGTDEAWQRVHDELYPQMQDLIVVGLSAGLVERRLREIKAQRQAEAKERHEWELMHSAEINRKANENTIAELGDRVYDFKSMSDREVQTLATKLKNEWRLQNDAERMEDIANA